MLRHQSAEDVGNLSGQPNPIFSCLSLYPHASMCMHKGLYNLSDYVASPGSPRQVSVKGWVSSTHASIGVLEAGASWSRQSESSISPM